LSKERQTTSALFININDGTGRFLSPYQIDLSTFYSDGEIRRLEAIDIDADGIPEPILVAHEAYQLSFTRGELSLFLFKIPVLPFDTADSIIARDLDGDSELDSVSCSGARLTVNIHQVKYPNQNKLNGRDEIKIASEIALDAPWRCKQLLWHDLDQDQNPELIVIADQPVKNNFKIPHQVFLFRIEEALLLKLGVVELPSLDMLVAADFNGDGRLDLLGSNSERYTSRASGEAAFNCRLYLGEGGANFALQRGKDPCPDGYLFGGIAAGDIDTDGDIDFVSVSYWMRFHLNDGRGSFTSPRSLIPRVF
jgi:hypothetical protein